jgi:hypothetical protein
MENQSIVLRRLQAINGSPSLNVDTCVVRKFYKEWSWDRLSGIETYHRKQ